MAATRTDFTLTAGYGQDDILTKLGELFFTAGMMTSATAWHDSFTDTNGSKVRILAETAGSGTRGTAYHAFVIPPATAGLGDRSLWYIPFATWNTTTHESGGTNNFDHVGNNPHPDQASYSSWSRWYTKLADFSNSADATLSLFMSSSANSAVVQITAPNEVRVIGFPLPGKTLDSAVPNLNDFSPSGFFAVTVGNGNNQGASGRQADGYITSIAQLKSDLLFGASNTGTGYDDYFSSDTLTGLPTRSATDKARHFSEILNHLIPPYAKAGYADGTPQNGYYGITDIRLYTGLYSDVTSGNLGFIYGVDAGFDPLPGDTLTVSAGVEEYYVLASHQNTGGYNNNNDWICAVVRTV